MENGTIPSNLENTVKSQLIDGRGHKVYNDGAYVIRNWCSGRLGSKGMDILSLLHWKIHSNHQNLLKTLSPVVGIKGLFIIKQGTPWKNYS